ncbi:G-protein coupled receptor 4-like [Mugil cephalus]|uniref:G-protein coupled receptor 4-like n=1 Tax=Mugil cephalus TaxID=48193 RepID=UPI001FB7DACE|nr:G-protein coupled receptor 4-like [Mugil cephalus]
MESDSSLIDHDIFSTGCFQGHNAFIRYVFTWISICSGLPLTIYAVYSLVRDDRCAPVYVINLLLSDLIQLCCLIGWVTDRNCHDIFIYLHHHALLANVGFMLCITLERYVVIVWSMSFTSGQTMKTSLVCLLVWLLPLVSVLPLYLQVDFQVTKAIFAVYLLVPFPLFILSLCGTLKVLSTCLRVPADEREGTVAVLVMVLLIYTFMFLPSIIRFLVKIHTRSDFSSMSLVYVELIPLADLTLYIITKGHVALRCCRTQLQ